MAVFVVSANVAALTVWPRLKSLRTAAELEGTEVYAALADIGNVAALAVLPRLKRLRTAEELEGTEVYAALADIGNVAALADTEVYAARSWQTGR